MARNILRAYKPKCVIGMGAYITFPVIVAAWWLNIPRLLHESNALLGLANHFSLLFVRQIALGLPLARTPRWPQGVLYEFVGTPLRPELDKVTSQDNSRSALGLGPGLVTLLIFGGSQGAKRINQIVPAAVKELAARHPYGFQVLHLSGFAVEKEVHTAYEGTKAKIVILSYLSEMEKAYGACDIVISRSGASTIAELCAVKKPAILIPFPFAAANHQEINAQVLVRAGAAEMIRERELTPQSLVEQLEDLIFSSKRLKEMAEGYKNISVPKAEESLDSLVRMVDKGVTQ